MPGIFGSLLAVTARHGVVEPAMWRGAVQSNVIIFLRPFQATAEPDHIINGYHMSRFAEDSQHRARHLCYEFFDRGRPKLIAIPFLTANGTIKHHSSSDIISIGGE